MENLKTEIEQAIIELNQALKKLDEQGNGFIDKKRFDAVFDAYNKLGKLLKLRKENEN